MYVEPISMCQCDEITNSQCVKWCSLPWNVAMVAAINDVSERTVRSAVRRNMTLVRQLEDPDFCYQRTIRRDLNKRDGVVIAQVGDLKWSWKFVRFLDKFNARDGEVLKGRRHRQLYKTWLNNSNLEDTPQNLANWLLQYAADIDPAVDDALYGSRSRSPYEVLLQRQEQYEPF